MNPRKKEVLEDSLRTWYEADATRQKALDDIVSGRAGVSLRTIDWLVTNYSVRNPILYEHQGKLVDVNGDYKDVLRCFHKIGFDSFKRRGGSDPSEANLRQRNFFRWALTNGVVDYVLNHSEEIERDMALAKHRKRHLSDGEEDEDEDAPRRRKQRATPAVLIFDKEMELQMPGCTKLDW